MPIKFSPKYNITSKMLNALMRIEAVKRDIIHLPLTPLVLKSLRETARLYTTHYSTMIEGNRLAAEQVKEVVKHEGHFAGRERDEKEVKGYYEALTKVEQIAASKTLVTENIIQSIHSLVMAGGKTKAKPTQYRDGQNVTRDSQSGRIVYMPPESKDVARLMKSMVAWINEAKEIPAPIIASIAHYQFATIHPYYDGNGRTARLLTTLVLHLGGYDLKGLYSLEEYYARNLGAYYKAISIGEHHNYYMGRAESDITKWVEYFTEGMAVAFENVLQRMNESKLQKCPDQSKMMRALDPRQRKALELFQDFEIVTSSQIGELFGFKPRTNAQICKNWVENGFLQIVDASNRGRKYRLASKYILKS